PVVLKAKKYGKKVVVIGVNQGFSVALKNVADYVEYL
ncbi:MAG TPA: NYN domain-containing protein, partial [Candidatus Aenigmarchaeota archaeon]|nr:NYN domain-containing protein [Candidatus Aenigmarchaeota archaeon]